MTEIPTVSADPLHQLIDHGFPLYRFKQKTRTIKVLEQDLVLSANNDYKPTKFITKKHVKVHKIMTSMPDLGDEFKKRLVDIVWNDMHDVRKLEEFDPLKGNSFVMTDDSVDNELIVFSGGPSLSNLVVAIISKSKEKVIIKHTIDLEYPIRQIQLSPLSDTKHKIILVRTTSSIHLLHINGDKIIIPKHRLFLPDLSEINVNVNYSMPIHVEPSPFYHDQYLFITNNGYTALMDTTNEKILFENLDPISEDINYQSRWRSCGFGNTPFTLYNATPNYIKEFIIRNDSISTNILAIPNETIVAFKTTNHSLYCFATTSSIAVMDSLYPERPLVTWLHRMRDGIPTDISIDQLSKNKWRITAFSKYTQRFTMISLHYINNPTKDCKPTIKILELFNFVLPVIKFEEIFNYTSRINSVGCYIETFSKSNQDTTKGNVILSIYRLFENGSITVNYISLNDDDDDENTIILNTPKYKQISNCREYNELISNLKSDLLPERLYKDHSSELVDLKMNRLNEYIKSIKIGSNSLSDDFKRKIADKVQDLKSTSTFKDLLDDNNNDEEEEEEEEEYQNYKLQDLNDFLDQMELHEEIERARQIDTFGIYHKGKPKDLELNQKLKQAHEKEIHLSSVMIRPLRDNEKKFRYIDSNINFKSTTTSKLLADLWSIDDTRYDQLQFPEYTTDHLLKSEVFPSVNIYKKYILNDDDHSIISPTNQSMPETSVPVISSQKKRKKETVILSDNEDIPLPKSLPKSLPNRKISNDQFNAVSTQPLPGVFGSRTKKPVKKKAKKTSGFR